MELHYNLQIAGSVSLTATPSESHLTVTDDGAPTPREVVLSPNQEFVINQSVIDALFGHHNPPANPPATGTGTFTYKVHMDLNGNGLQDLDEPDGHIPTGTILSILPRDGSAPITIDLSGELPTSGRVDHFSLPVGVYDMSVAIPAGYHTLGVPVQVIHITDGADVNMGFIGLIAE